jgi:hypothetical protein
MFWLHPAWTPLAPETLRETLGQEDPAQQLSKAMQSVQFDTVDEILVGGTINNFRPIQFNQGWRGPVRSGFGPVRPSHAVLDDYATGYRIPSIAIGLRSIEECFSKNIMGRSRSSYPWIAIDEIRYPCKQD